MSARFALKEATNEAHETLDAAMSRFDLTDVGDYGRFLTAQAAALFPMEATLDHAGAQVHYHPWQAARRGPALAADMHALGLPIPPPVAIQPIVGEPDIFGTLYVLEGSRLGGKMLARGVPEALPSAFLEHRGTQTWPEFSKLLDQKLASPVDLSVAKRAASHAFDAFARAAESISSNDEQA